MQPQSAATVVILPFHDRAFKEWAVACEAMMRGIQTVLIRKGGIREEDGIFRVADSEFFLMPTYEHQNPALLRDGYKPLLETILTRPHDPRSVTIDCYAIVDTVSQVTDEDRLSQVQDQHIWNDEYIRLRLDFNPYDPLYVILLRVYRLPESVTLPLLLEYEGCKSWVTLETPLPTAGAKPVLSDSEFSRVRETTLSLLT